MRLKFGNYTIRVGTILIIIIASIVLSGATIFSYIRIPRIWLCGLIGIIFLLVKKKIYITSTIIGKIFGVWILFLIINLLFSYTPGKTLNAIIIFISLFFLLCYEFDIKDMELFYRIVRIVCITYAISVVINVLIPSLMYDSLSKLIVFDKSIIKNEVAKSAYCGLVGDRNQTAFYMNIGLVFEIGIFNKNGKLSLKNKLFIILYLVSLMLTGKRTLFAVSLLLIAFSLCNFDIKGKWSKIIMGVLVTIPVFIIIMQVIPQTNIVLERLIENTGDVTLNGRKNFWDFCLYMFAQHPIIGFGYDSFNTAFSNIAHFIYKGQEWNMYAHSIYYELLGETGIVGFGIFITLQLTALIISINFFKKKRLNNANKVILFASIGIQIVFAIYGITGNVLYQHCQLVFYIMSLAMLLTIIRKNKFKIKGD